MKPRQPLRGGFIGSPEMNLIEGSIQDGTFVASEGLRLPLPDGAKIGDRGAVVYGIRPQHIAMGGDHLKATVQVVEPTGEAQEVIFSAGGIDFVVEVRDQPILKPGQEIPLRIMTNKTLLFDAGSGGRL